MKTLMLTVVTQNMCFEDNVLCKHILKQKQMLQNLLVLCGSTRGTPAKRLKAIDTQGIENCQDHCGLKQVVQLNFPRTH